MNFSFVSNHCNFYVFENTINKMNMFELCANSIQPLVQMRSFYADDAVHRLVYDPVVFL